MRRRAKSARQEPKKMAPLNQDGGDWRAGLVERQSKVNLLHVRTNVLAALCP